MNKNVEEQLFISKLISKGFTKEQIKNILKNNKKSKASLKNPIEAARKWLRK